MKKTLTAFIIAVTLATPALADKEPKYPKPLKPSKVLNFGSSEHNIEDGKFYFNTCYRAGISQGYVEIDMPYQVLVKDDKVLVCDINIGRLYKRSLYEKYQESMSTYMKWEEDQRNSQFQSAVDQL
jgi:hypothetical protein